MPVLANPRRERFAQERAQGRSVQEAYAAAGYKGAYARSSPLARRPEIPARIAEIQRHAAERAEITVETVLRQLARLAFSDIRMIARWSGARREAPEAASADEVELIASDAIGDNGAAAIAEVRKNKDGSMRIKLRDSLPALIAIGKHLGMFDRSGNENVGASYVIGSDPIEDPEEWAKAYAPKRD